MRIAVAIVLLAALITAANAEPDVMLRAVGFAVTGSDDAEAKAIDRANCIFAVKNEIFHFNNIHVDRISFQSWVETNRLLGDRHFVAVTLHGDSTVYEKTEEGLKERYDTESAAQITRELLKTAPDVFRPKHSKSNEQSLSLATADIDRVRRAWEYIYSHGCVGKKSPF